MCVVCCVAGGGERLMADDVNVLLVTHRIPVRHMILLTRLRFQNYTAKAREMIRFLSTLKKLTVSKLGDG